MGFWSFMAKPYKRKGSRFYWIAPTIDGRQVPQSSGETDYDAALRKLKILEGEIASNAPVSAKTDRGNVAELLDLVIEKHTILQRASLQGTKYRIRNHLKPAVGHLRVNKVTSNVAM